ncbi:uncharacterized protein N7482_010045 [Penicillium canariense]|uniref:Uncharacterized protein n=1 Tax=Penicillium canariense TaxID=189055 RepID=A0A9W9HQY3_9EURO|nr:uncharacterized protein N7482_010045 [Penicillium canariense]KAJ5153567.1 hypothetical protein N7482_010045 [Penicillium canariense]
MPALRDAELFTWLTWRPSKERAKEYEGSNDVPLTSYEEETVMFRWGVGEDWRPEDGVIKAFEDLVGGDGENMEWKAFEFVEEREQDPGDYI